MVEQMRLKQECAVCPVKVHQVVNGKLRRTDEYKEIDLKMSDLSVMRVAVCSQHTDPTRGLLVLSIST